jgi:hypothetical protein
MRFQNEIVEFGGKAANSHLQTTSTPLICNHHYTIKRCNILHLKMLWKRRWLLRRHLTASGAERERVDAFAASTSVPQRPEIQFLKVPRVSCVVIIFLIFSGFF